MASIHDHVVLDVSAERAWMAVRRVGEAHKLFAPVLADSQVDGDIRIARFANGMVVHEHILDVDDERRRVAYTVTDGPGMAYHHASMEIVEQGPSRCLFVWITDFLPNEIADNLRPLIEQGITALKTNLEHSR